MSEEAYIIQPKKCDANSLICKSTSTHKILFFRIIFFIFLFILDKSFDDEVLVSKEVIVHKMNFKGEILDLFLQKDIPRYNLKKTVKDARGNVESGEGEGVVKDILCSFLTSF